MKDIFDALYSDTEWEEFYRQILDNDHVHKHEKKYLRKYIDEKRYLTVLKSIETAGGFPVPKLILVNKKATERKRRVFCFEDDYSWILKMISVFLHEYDYIFSDNLYSFRKNISARTAISKLVAIKNINEMYAYKLDIHDYFNSVDTAEILLVLKETLKGQDKLISLIENILTNPYAYDEGELVTTQKGIMAGTSISPFLANLYLKDIDERFHENKVIYFRYSDDIIMFDSDLNSLNDNKDYLNNKLVEKGLKLNPSKICSYNPHDEWEYLGVSYQDGRVDISKVSLEKMKGKLRRKAHAIYRWKLKTGADNEKAIRAYIRHFNRKFYDNPKKSELTWCRWYFPLINSTKRLEIIDHYMQECIRYIATGRHSKANYNLRYETMKGFGYRPLVSEFYKPPQNDKIP